MAVSICGWNQLMNGPGIGKKVNCFDRAFLNPNYYLLNYVSINTWEHPFLWSSNINSWTSCKGQPN